MGLAPGRGLEAEPAGWTGQPAASASRTLALERAAGDDCFLTGWDTLSSNLFLSCQNQAPPEPLHKDPGPGQAPNSRTPLRSSSRKVGACPVRTPWGGLWGHGSLPSLPGSPLGMSPLYSSCVSPGSQGSDGVFPAAHSPDGIIHGSLQIWEESTPAAVPLVGGHQVWEGILGKSSLSWASVFSPVNWE